MSARDLLLQAVKSAKHFCLEEDFWESYHQAKSDGFSEEGSIWHALYEWDIILLPESGEEDAHV